MTLRPAILLLPLLAVLACGEPEGGAARGPDDGPGHAASDATAAAPDPASRPAAPAAALPPAADPGAICDTIDNSFRCARAIEAARLPHTPRAARRDGILLLTLSGGDTLRLVDRPGEGNGVVYYSYQDHWRGSGWFVVQEQHYEGSAYLLIDQRTGERTDVPARPLLAPGGARFAVLSFDLEAGYAPNTLQIWSLGEGRPVLEWEIEPETWGPTDGRWTDAETLTFTRRCGAGPAEGVECDGRATLRRTVAGWILTTEDGDG